MNSKLSKVESYTQTINTLRSSLNLDYDLDRKILDILPKLIEARARYWTKGDHGYFTGSYSDGNSGGTPNCSGGMGVISGNKGLTKSKGGGIITTGKIYSFDEYADNPLLLGECSSAEMYKLFIDAGLQVLPLGNGAFKGVPFDQGGGYRVFFDNTMQKMLMYHPASRSHHGSAYFKLSDGKFGTHRYNLDGTEKEI